MKTDDPHHLAFARMRDFPFRCDPWVFSEEQYATVKRWGHWMQALASGRLVPLTEAQQAFVRAVQSHAPPAEHFAQAWWRYERRMLIEAKNGTAMHTTYQVDADTFYSREMVKQQRRITTATNFGEHRRS
ncbi:MAG: DUF413 domain-containing protein [Flavobacteriales bacterium]|nr:DUF413 domain-containing protein [Flavobacteriales bacterium]